MKDSISFENYIPDNPVDSKEQDRFQRYPFAQRIAETIIARKAKESIVIGLFGEWGEGKSSVINFIKKEISNQSSEYIQVTFNPWRFTDESTLLATFFNTLALKVKEAANSEINIEDTVNRANWFARKTTKIKTSWNKSKGPLQNNIEKVGELLKDYGQLASFIKLGKAAESIGKKIGETDIEELKHRIGKLLELSKKRIVIYIDDIDRLDKDEMHSIFRLVKLTGDFAFTSYILSFDEKMVASAIGNRFGEGNKRSGKNFLEKIIQVPLQIPKAQSKDLNEYALEIIEKSMKNNGIILSEQETQRFIEQFTKNILPKLNTPRLAVRYGNSISFTLPLLKNEVNMVDLLLIQAINIFYPNHYLLVKDNPDYFISTYSNIYGGGKNEKKVERLKKRLNKIGEELTEEHKANIQELLTDLFPLIKTAFTPYHNNYEQYENNWYKEMNISSEHYFNRYFSFTVLKGDISDVTFKNFISELESEDDLAKLDLKLKKILEFADKKSFTIKLRSFENSFNLKSSKKLAYLLSDNIHLFSNKNGFMGINYGTPFNDLALIIFHLIKNEKNNTDQFEFAKEMMEYPRFDFAYAINNWLRSGRTPEEKIFEQDQYMKLAEVLVRRAENESKPKTIFEEFPYYIGFLINCWKEIDSKSYDQYVKSYLDLNHENVFNLLESFLPMQTMTSEPEPFRADLDEKIYERISKNLDESLILQTIKKLEVYNKLEDEEVYWNPFGEEKYSRLNMLRQFKHWYENKNSR